MKIVCLTGCSKLTSVDIQEGVKIIGESAFSSCRALTTVTIPESLREIQDYGFSSCSSLTNITLPKDFLSIGNNAFEMCNGLKSIIIAGRIGDEAFNSCSNLETVTILKSSDIIKTSIGREAFSQCSISYITIPGNVIDIEYTYYKWSLEDDAVIYVETDEVAELLKDARFDTDIIVDASKFE